MDSRGSPRLGSLDNAIKGLLLSDNHYSLLKPCIHHGNPLRKNIFITTIAHTTSNQWIFKTNIKCDYGIKWLHLIYCVKDYSILWMWFIIHTIVYQHILILLQLIKLQINQAQIERTFQSIDTLNYPNVIGVCYTTRYSVSVSTSAQNN